MRIAAFDPARERLATRLVFCLADICLGAWAPLVPLAKQRLRVDEGTLGFLLLCMGVGSIATMPFTAHLTSRFGCRRIIPAAVAGLIVLLPLSAELTGVQLNFELLCCDCGRKLEASFYARPKQLLEGSTDAKFCRHVC